MRDEHEMPCCTGQCLQGRECPRFQRSEDRGSRIEKGLSVMGWFLLACFLAGYLYGVLRP